MLQTSISSQLTRKRMLVGEMKDSVHLMTYIVMFLWEIIGSRLFSWGRGRSEIKAVIRCWQLAFLVSYCSSKISRLLKFENVKHSKYRKICGINDQLLFLQDQPPKTMMTALKVRHNFCGSPHPLASPSLPGVISTFCTVH